MVHHPPHHHLRPQGHQQSVNPNEHQRVQHHHRQHVKFEAVIHLLPRRPRRQVIVVAVARVDVVVDVDAVPPPHQRQPQQHQEALACSCFFRCGRLVWCCLPSRHSVSIAIVFSFGQMLMLPSCL
jgi:hypothetical protein